MFHRMYYFSDLEHIFRRKIHHPPHGSVLDVHRPHIQWYFRKIAQNIRFQLEGPQFNIGRYQKRRWIHFGSTNDKKLRRYSLSYRYGSGMAVGEEQNHFPQFVQNENFNYFGYYPHVVRIDHESLQSHVSITISIYYTF